MFNKNKKGGMIDGIVMITIGVIMMTAVFLPQIHSTNTTGWSTSEVTLFGTLGLAGIIGILVGTFRVFGIL